MICDDTASNKTIYRRDDPTRVFPNFADLCKAKLVKTNKLYICTSPIVGYIHQAYY